MDLAALTDLKHLHGLHLRGKISLGTAYASGTAANPIPIKH